MKLRLTKITLSINEVNGDAEVSDLVKVTNISAINVEKVMTAEFTLSDSDGSICGSICATKIFDSAL